LALRLHQISNGATGLARAGIALTMITDYRLLVFTGSAWEQQLAAWTTERGSPVVGDSGPGVGARAPVSATPTTTFGC
jgi:hypothetical protein